MKKKLVEVALPLEAINREAVRESYIYRGNPSAIHKWWTQKPFAVARCMLFASLVDDPASQPDRFPTPEQQDARREYLFRLMERLSKWEAINDHAILAEARAVIAESTGHERLLFLDPFSGGATLPLEAQRLGIDAIGADLNPVATLIARGLLEFPREFAGRSPVHPDSRRLESEAMWDGATGLAEDVGWYGEWLRDAARERLQMIYPRASTEDGSEAPVLAWLWARMSAVPTRHAWPRRRWRDPSRCLRRLRARHGPSRSFGLARPQSNSSCVKASQPWKGPWASAGHGAWSVMSRFLSPISARKEWPVDWARN